MECGKTVWVTICSGIGMEPVQKSGTAGRTVDSRLYRIYNDSIRPCRDSVVGFRTGNPRVGNLTTVPVPPDTVPLPGKGTTRPVFSAVSNETRGTASTRVIVYYIKSKKLNYKKNVIKIISPCPPALAGIRLSHGCG